MIQALVWSLLFALAHSLTCIPVYFFLPSARPPQRRQAIRNRGWNLGTFMSLGDRSDNNLDSTNDAALGDNSISEFYEQLRLRQSQLDEGIGKRYITRTQKGFLNVHSYPGDPFETENIVAQLCEGQIVISVGPSVENWIEHDVGGWSIATFDGFNWLEPLDR
jgi:hypothetical protein